MAHTHSYGVSDLYDSLLLVKSPRFFSSTVVAAAALLYFLPGHLLLSIFSHFTHFSDFSLLSPLYLQPPADLYTEKNLFTPLTLLILHHIFLQLPMKLEAAATVVISNVQL